MWHEDRYDRNRGAGPRYQLTSLADPAAMEQLLSQGALEPKATPACAGIGTRNTASP